MDAAGHLLLRLAVERKEEDVAIARNLLVIAAEDYQRAKSRLAEYQTNLLRAEESLKDALTDLTVTEAEDMR